jgi:hypothetical protein
MGSSIANITRNIRAFFMISLPLSIALKAKKPSLGLFPHEGFNYVLPATTVCITVTPE